MAMDMAMESHPSVNAPALTVALYFYIVYLAEFVFAARLFFDYCKKQIQKRSWKIR